MKNIFKDYLKKFFSDLHSAILGLFVAAIILSLGGIWVFSNKLWSILKSALIVPTPLWLTIAIFLFVIAAYILLRKRMSTPLSTPDPEYKEEFHVLWDTNLKMRCLNCGKPLKYSSSDSDPSIFFCCDPRCNSKHILKDTNGNKISEQKALDSIESSMNIMAIGISEKDQETQAIQSIESNIPDYFPALNETTLKKHVASSVSHCQFKNDIINIFLYEGTPFKYQLVLVAKNTKDFNGVKNYWDRSPSDIFENHFDEVYLNEPIQNFWDEWNIVVVLSLDEIRDDLILKKYRWVLY